MSDELPLHVKKYLKDMKVSEDDLSKPALEMFASLSGGEIALLRQLGKALAKVEPETILKVH